MVLIIDPQNSGISGNMIAGAFVDLGCDSNEIKRAMETVAIDFGGVNVSINKVIKSGIESTFLEVEIIDKNNPNNHSISYNQLLAKINEIEMNESRAQASLVACTLDPMGKESPLHSERSGGRV